MVELALPSVVCPKCNSVVKAKLINVPQGSGAPAASSFESCLRQCHKCGIGFSNGNSSDILRLTQIYASPYDIWPPEIRDECDEALSGALNEVNRPNKRNKLAFSTSEDHLSWTVFRYLQTSERLGEIFRGLGLLQSSVEPHILMWGAPVPGAEAEPGRVRAELVRICDRLGERPNRRSEPDVILWSEEDCVFIEVKYRSANERRPAAYRNWDRYLNSPGYFADPDRVLQSEAYELARNWRIGSEVAGTRRFNLINLAPERLFRSDAVLLSEFRESLNQTNERHFTLLPWEALVDALGVCDQWLKQYLVSRRLQRESVELNEAVVEGFIPLCRADEDAGEKNWRVVHEERSRDPKSEVLCSMFHHDELIAEQRFKRSERPRFMELLNEAISPNRNPPPPQ